MSKTSATWPICGAPSRGRLACFIRDFCDDQELAVIDLDTGLAQDRVSAGQVPVGVEALVDGDRLLGGRQALRSPRTALVAAQASR